MGDPVLVVLVWLGGVSQLGQRLIGRTVRAARREVHAGVLGAPGVPLIGALGQHRMGLLGQLGRQIDRHRHLQTPQLAIELGALRSIGV